MRPSRRCTNWVQFYTVADGVDVLVEDRRGMAPSWRRTIWMRLHFAGDGVSVLVEGRRGVIPPAAATSRITRRRNGGRWQKSGLTCERF